MTVPLNTRPQPTPLMIPEIAIAALPDDERLWVPQAPNVWFRPLLLNTVNGEWVNLLRVKRAGMLSRHRHPAPVHGYVIRGSWRYLEHDWVAREGMYVFEPPGEIHTLVVDPDVPEMITLFHVCGAVIYYDEQMRPTGHDDVHTKLDLARRHYEAGRPGRGLRAAVRALSGRARLPPSRTRQITHPCITFYEDRAMSSSTASGPGRRRRPTHGVLFVEGQPTILFDTVCTKDRTPWLAFREVHELLQEVWSDAQAWLMGRYVIMPDHVHFFAAATDSLISYENWVKYWKSQFTKRHGVAGHRWQTDHWEHAPPHTSGLCRKMAVCPRESGAQAIGDHTR